MNVLASAIAALVNQKESLKEILSGNPTFYSRRDAENRLYFVNGLLQAIDKLVEREEFLSPSDVKWEFDGGDPAVSAYLALSAINTAYFSLFYAWKREKVGSTAPVYWMDGEDEVLPDLPNYDDANMAASAAVRYLVHLARFPGLSWLSRCITTYRDWANAHASRVSPEEALVFRQSAEFITLESLSVEDSITFLRLWLYEPAPWEVFQDRHERIVRRVADAQADKFLSLVLSDDVDSLKKAAKKLQLWELFLASDYLKQLASGYKSSIDYEERLRLKRLEELEVLVQRAVEQQARAERLAKLDEREKDLEKRLDALLSKTPATGGNSTLATQLGEFLKKYSQH